MMKLQSRTPIEEIVARIWMEVLKLEEVGIYDNFFELGGDSLRATRVISRLLNVFKRELFECNVEFEGVLLNAIFEDSTVAALAATIERAPRVAQAQDILPLLPVLREEPLPISFTQTLWWFSDRLDPGNPAYNITNAIRLTREGLDTVALQKGFNEIVRRHEALRTTFAVVDGFPVQIVSPTLAVPLPVVDLQELTDPEREAEALRLIKERSRTPFDLSEGPLLRTTLFRLAEDAHVLLVTMHHIVSDGWSMGVFFQELSILYEAFSKGRASPLPELPIQYADFTVWQRQRMQGKVLEDLLTYWRQQLSGELPVLELPTDQPHALADSYQEANQAVAFSKSLTDSLRALSQREGVTLFMALLAAFNALLHRYTGQDDILVGTPIANRNHVELEGLIGCFINTLVMRTDLTGNPSFRDLLQRVRHTALEAYSYQDLPFEKLVEKLRPERVAGRTPILQVMLVLQNAPSVLPSLPGLTGQLTHMHNGATRFDLTLDLSETADGLRGEIEYNAELFEDITIIRMISHLQTLLEGIVANPEQHLSELPILTSEERHLLLVEWNSTQKDFPKDLCIHEIFESQVERTPNAVAVTFESHQLTYQELNQQANQLAHYLQALGVGPETLVGICVERSLHVIVGLLGILKAGAAYVPLDPAYPKERLVFMLEDVQPPVLVTQKRLMSSLPEQGMRVVCLDTDGDMIAKESTLNPVSEVTPDNLAYVIYTSGSTGRPKGILGLHRGAVNRFSWMWETYPLEATEVCCQKTSLNFVDSIWEIFGPLLQGVPLVIIPDEEVKDPARLVNALAKHNVTRIVLVPSLLDVILDTYGGLQERLSRLRLWVTSGETLSNDTVHRAREFMPSSTLLNLYGSSEVSADVTWHDTSRDRIDRISVPVGRPISNTQIHILDRYLQPVPVGIPGEIHVGGEGLARGYLNRPDLTADRFIPNSFSGQAGARLYKTGDIACYRPDGTIEFLGRVDYQVKIRGIRIEPGEIESVLQDHPSVHESVVIPREDVPGSKYLAAYVVLCVVDVTESELRHYLRRRLPEYMVPSTFVILEALPLTPNGKVDHRALPVPRRAGPEHTHVVPSNQLERATAEIWKKLLGLERVGIHDNFFQLGGHSLLAVQLISRLRSSFQVELPLRSLLRAPTIAELSMEILRRQMEQVDSEMLKQMLGDIKPLSKEEVQRLLAVEREHFEKGEGR